MNKNKKNLHKVTANVLGITLASVMAAGTVADTVAPTPIFAAEQTQNKKVKTAKIAKTIYLNGSTSAKETADGGTKETAVSSLEKALQLAGGQGVVAVCGTVTVSNEKKITIPAGVTIKRADGFTGSLIKITGAGKLLVTGAGIQASDVDTSSADAGKDAFQLGSTAEKQKAPAVAVPSEVALNTPDEWSSYAFLAPAFTGDGTFAWQNDAAPYVYESSVQVLFTPKDVKNYDYSGVPGWDAASGKVVRTVKVTIASLKPQEEQKPEEQPEQKPEKEPASVEMPEEVKVQTKEEWAAYDFAASGFTGNGTFAWEAETEPSAYEMQMNVVFTPADTEKFDYTQVPGWNQETGTVVRNVKVLTESLKTPEKEETKPGNKPSDTEQPDKGENKPSDTEQPGKGENTPSDTEQPDKGENAPSDVEQPDKDENKPSDTEQPDKDENKPSDSEQNKEEETTSDSDTTIIERIEDMPAEENQEAADAEQKEELPHKAEPGMNGEVAADAPEAIPVGSLIDESGVQVYGDFIPFYVDLQVSYNDAVHELPDAGIGEILSAYELKLWDLKEDAPYQIPEGKKVKVMLPLPENAGDFSDISIAHYLGNYEYEYFVFASDGKSGNMTIEVQGGREYLTFETASFSPFNVGGHQIVGPGTSSGGHKPSTGTSNTAKPSDTSKPSGNTGSKNGGSTGGKGTAASANNNGTQNNKTPSAPAKNNNGTKVIHTVKTGDESQILLYVSAGVAALLLAVAALIIGKKKK